MTEKTDTSKSKEILDRVFREAVKDLLIKRPFARAVRLDNVSATILGTVGVVLTLYVGIASLVLQKQTTYQVAIFVLLPSIVLILSLTSLVLAIRSREIMVPTEISLDTYLKFLQEISKINDKKKKFQDIGLALFILGTMLIALFLVIWVLY